MQKRLAVTLVSHTYLERGYRGKLDELGRTVILTLVTPSRFPFAYGSLGADFADASSYRVLPLPTLFPLGIRTSTRWVLRSRDMELRASRPDIIHVENELSSLILLQTLVLRRLYALRARVVVFVWQNLPIGGAKGLVLNPLARWARRGIDFYIAGNSEGEALLHASGIPPDRTAVLPQVGVRIERYVARSAEERAKIRQELGFADGDFVIGFVGRLIPQKGVLDLLAALECLRAEDGMLQARLLCVGDGSLKPQLEARRSAVLVKSPGGSEQVIPYYHAMDALVLPSRTTPHWKEQFGLVLAEAMAASVPVVGSDSGAIPEVLGDAGITFPEGDVGALVAALKRLAAPQTREELAARGRERVRAKFSAEVIAAKTLDLYRRVMNLPRCGGRA